MPDSKADRSDQARAARPSRRELVAGAATALTGTAALAVPLSAAIAQGSAATTTDVGNVDDCKKTPDEPKGRTEGYFLVFQEPGNQNRDRRVFFVSSEWLSYFEVTGAYENKRIDPKDVADKIRSKNSNKKQKMFLLYGDDASIDDPVPGTKLLMPKPPCQDETYLASMITPDDIEQGT